MPPAQQKLVGNYAMGRTLGSGAFATVKMATHTLTGYDVAIKICKKGADYEDTERFHREIQTLRHLDHPCIVRLLEIIDSSDKTYVVMELVSEVTLFDYIVQQGRLTEPEACYLFRSILAGVYYCHKHKVVHRDLKPENVLVTESKDIKLLDFGMCNVVKAGQLMSTSCGSPSYVAPEILTGKSYSGPEVDIWSLGVILYAMTCGYLPYEDENQAVMFKQIREANYELPDHVSPALRHLLSRIMDPNHKTRITIREIREHEWTQTACSVSQKHLFTWPTDRQNMYLDQDILKHMQQLGWSPAQTALHLKHNKRNSMTATYYILLQFQGKKTHFDHYYQQQARKKRSESRTGSRKMDTEETEGAAQVPDKASVGRVNRAESTSNLDKNSTKPANVPKLKFTAAVEGDPSLDPTAPNWVSPRIDTGRSLHKSPRQHLGLDGAESRRDTGRSIAANTNRDGAPKSARTSLEPGPTADVVKSPRHEPMKPPSSDPWALVGGVHPADMARPSGPSGARVEVAQQMNPIRPTSPTASHGGVDRMTMSAPEKAETFMLPDISAGPGTKVAPALRPRPSSSTGGRRGGPSPTPMDLGSQGGNPMREKSEKSPSSSSRASSGSSRRSSRRRSSLGVIVAEAKQIAGELDNESASPGVPGSRSSSRTGHRPSSGRRSGSSSRPSSGRASGSSASPLRPLGEKGGRNTPDSALSKIADMSQSANSPGASPLPGIKG
eukprot:TRINITY_DN5012_c0_g1_i1.p1 TRINITY_DN5012_c0_g1~~TRINITY_DN5012_c0_g1_i1.p1  ORF type:complete len:725 (-),score=141.90 TRINITY_DN5012_c0_g1_i1:112-2286(-)